jgi:hypothetical protein
MANERKVQLGDPFITVNDDGTADAHFSWTPPEPLPQDVIDAKVHFRLPLVDVNDADQVAAFLISVKDQGRQYIRDHEAGLRPVPVLPDLVAKYNGQVVSLDLDAQGT